MSADTAAAKELRAYLERIERLESVRKDAADDIADVYKELAGRGFDKDAAKVILKIRRTDGGVDAWTGKSQTIDMYLSALGMLPEIELAPAPARVHGNIEQFNPETGEITDTQEQPETASQSHPEKSVTSNLVAAHEGDESAALNSPETANEILGGVAGACSGIKCGENRTGTESETSGDSAERHADDGRDVEATGGAASVITIPHSAVTPPAADKTGAAPLPSSAAPVELTDEDVPAFLRKSASRFVRAASIQITAPATVLTLAIAARLRRARSSQHEHDCRYKRPGDGTRNHRLPVYARGSAIQSSARHRTTAPSQQVRRS